jgi:hypothetical protein
MDEKIVTVMAIGVGLQCALTVGAEAAKVWRVARENVTQRGPKTFRATVQEFGRLMNGPSLTKGPL